VGENLNFSPTWLTHWEYIVYVFATPIALHFHTKRELILPRPSIVHEKMKRGASGHTTRR
jgi:hypothetical protein